MMEELVLFGILVCTYLLAVTKRLPGLIRSFRMQSFFIFLTALFAGFREASAELYFIAFLILVLKVLIIPRFLALTSRRVSADENLGLIINPQLSLFAALLLTYCSWVFCSRLGLIPGYTRIAICVSFSVVFIGAYLMISRMKAFTQVIGLLCMENGIFLLASSISGGMPFFVEIAVFFDVFVSVIVMGLFVYRIGSLFTHINVDKLSRLRG